MSGINLPNVDSGLSVEDLANLVARFIKEIQWFSDGNISANNIKANSITAVKMDVDQLSAIAADLGTITAGIIYGAYIATANGTYPRIELSSLGNLLTAYFNAANHVDIVPDLLGVPAIVFTKASSSVGFISAGGAVSLTATIELDVGSTQNVFISAGTNLTVRSSSGTITDIVATVNSKANSFSGYTGSFVAGVKTVTVNNGIITSVV